MGKCEHNAAAWLRQGQGRGCGCGLRLHGCVVAERDAERDAEMQRCRDAEMQRCRDAELHQARTRCEWEKGQLSHSVADVSVGSARRGRSQKGELANGLARFPPDNETPSRGN
jgi:hypothetical protein